MSSTSGVALHRSVELVKGQQAIAIFVRLHEGRCRVLLLKLLLLLLLTLLLLPPLLLNFSFLLLILLLLLLPLLLPTDQTELPRLQRAFCIFSDHGDFLIRDSAGPSADGPCWHAAAEAAAAGTTGAAVSSAQCLDLWRSNSATSGEHWPVCGHNLGHAAAPLRLFDYLPPFLIVDLRRYLDRLPAAPMEASQDI